MAQSASHCECKFDRVKVCLTSISLGRQEYASFSCKNGLVKYSYDGNFCLNGHLKCLPAVGVASPAHIIVIALHSLLKSKKTNTFHLRTQMYPKMYFGGVSCFPA